MRNTIKCYEYGELNEDLLKEFSEGSKALENLLICCYKNKIETRACCIGHEENGPQSKPYISMVVPEEQQYLIENIINNLFNQGKLSEYVEVDISKENNNSLVIFRFNYLEDGLRDSFFNLIQNTISNTLINGMNEQGIYDGLFSAYRQISFTDNIILTINLKSLILLETREEYCNLINNRFVNVPKEEAEYCIPTLIEKDSIRTEEIVDFISNKKESRARSE